MKKNGFTLIELLIVIVLLSFVMTIAANILVTTLRSANKTSVSTRVSQNGTAAVQQITDFIRFARDFKGVKELSGDSYNTNCSITSSYPNPVTGYHYLRLITPDFDSVNDKYVPVTFFCGSDQDAINNSEASPVSSNSASLIDTNTISVQSCSFTCSQVTENSQPVIGINLVLKQKAAGTAAENQSTLSFTSSTAMRNYQQQ